MIRTGFDTLLLATSLVVVANAIAQPQSGPQSARGELLYSTHCIACHSAQIHWRAKKMVVDWTSLKAEVRRWAGNGGLRWSDEEIVDVARYLNATVYRFPSVPGTELGGPPPPTPGSSG
jgi:mono/diheme cytochrome c family protein